jgi:dTDP-4-amino-4,6-dideoxygalactose transaminase
MKKVRIPLCDITVSPAAKREVGDTLRTAWLSTGPKARKFEEAVARRLKVKHGVALNSATSGLFLALKGMGIQPDDEVITVPYTFAATVETILHCGARPVMVDIDSTTLTMDPDSLARRISRQTRLVIPVDLAGAACDYKRIRTICSRYEVPILADAAHAFGSLHRGKSMAQLVDAAVYSFYATKNLTCGEGGMVVSKDRKLIDQIRLLSRHGMSSNAHQRKSGGEWEYDISVLGYKANMSDPHAAIGLGQLSRFEKDQRQRERIAARYSKNLSDLTELVELPKVPVASTHSWHLYIIKLIPDRLGLSRDQFVEGMAKQGIECGVHYKPVFEFSYYRKLGYRPSDTPVAASIWKRVVSLPIFPGLTGAQVDRVCDTLRRLLQSRTR